MNELQILEEALLALKRTAGVCAHAGSKARSQVGFRTLDSLVDIAHNNKKTTFAAEVKSKVDRAVIPLQVAQQFQHSKIRPLLVAPYIGPEIAQLCRKHELAFVDCAGNAYLNLPGNLVFIVGQKPSQILPIQETSQRAFGESGLRILYNCLVDPALLQAPLRAIAKAAGSALGSVSTVFSELKRHGFLATDNKGRRHWIAKERVIQAWMTNYPLALRPKLAPRRFQARDSQWWDKVEVLSFGMQWGGEIGAHRLIAEMEPRIVTLYAHEPITKFVGAHRLISDPAGDIEIIHAFWPKPDGSAKDSDIVSALLICSDLMALADPRAIEVARHIHDRYLA